MHKYEADRKLCTRCGLCVSDCITHSISMDDTGYPVMDDEQEKRCIECQHCLAICPTGAVSFMGKTASGSRTVSASCLPDYPEMSNLVRSRRSIRHYKMHNVDPVLLQDILETLAHAPTGVNARKLTFNIIDDIEVMQRFEDRIVDLFLEVDKQGILEQVHPRFHALAAAPREIIIANLFRNAPHAIIISADETAACPREDIALALAYFELLAQSAGLGTVWWGYLSALTAVIPQIRELIGVPENHSFYSMLFGIPSIKFARTVQRQDSAKVRTIEI